MSRKGVTTLCKSKQIPRIFQRRSHSCYGGVRATWESVNVDENNIDSNQRYATSHLFLDASEADRKQLDDVKRGKQQQQRDNGACDGADYATRAWNANCCQSVGVVNAVPVTIDSETIEKNTDAAETVADIEKWLKTRTESVSSMDLDTMKSVVEEEEEEEAVGVERYLADDLPHTFLGKDPDGLSIDIDLSDKKLNLGYDPILQELQSDKLLEACEKNDDFALPEFRLDHLDPLALSPDDMMLAGEILPSTSNQLSLVAAIRGEEDPGSDGIGDNDNTDDSAAQEISAEHAIDNGFPNRAKIGETNDETEFDDNEDNCLIGEIASFVHPIDSTVKTRNENRSARVRKLKSKLEPRIMKRGRKITCKTESNVMRVTDGECHIEGKDGIMAVVAISTDKISNMTQIVINNGKEEQIYQGKTSVLIEATGNFPKLPRIDAAGNWSNGTETGSDAATSTQNDMVISNALEELGITDECLQPATINENGRTWLCPRDDCSREFTKLHALKGHLLAHYGVRPFKCDFEGCAWAFHSEFKLKRHKETHLKRKDFVCEVPDCNRRFTTVYNLWSHEKLHTRPNRISCQVPDCQEKFQTKRALELHMKTHDQSHAPYVCNHDGCGKRYYSSNALTSHQRCHSYKEIDVKCSWAGCGKVFDKPCRLKAHIRSHTGCKPYCCTYQDCQWAFSSSSKLKRHEKKHTNERKFICDVDGCGKAFMRSEHLKEHSLTHKEGRDFQCYMCDARFSAKSSLYVHIKKHQVKEGVDTATQRHCKASKRQMNESQTPTENCTTEAINGEDATGLEEFNEDSSISSTFVQAPAGDDSLVSTRCFIQSPNDILSRIDTRPDYYICSVDECSKSLKTSSNLRARMLTMHENSVEDGDKSSIGVGNVSSVTNMDYVLYTTPMVKAMNQMVMIEPCEAITSSSSPENVECPPEPEPPPLDSTSRLSQSSYHEAVEDLTFDQRAKRANQGSARTGLTRADVWKLKANGHATQTAAVGATDVVLGTADLTEGLLLTEELSSMYYQDDMVGTECQILMLDAGTSEHTIHHLRGLE